MAFNSGSGRAGRARRGRPVRPPVVGRAEALEPRTLLAFVGIGPTFRVDNGTPGNVGGSRVASDADGDFVVIFNRHDGTSWDLFGQRYSAAGVAQGGEFPVSTAAGDQVAPAVAMDADGDFVVTWQSNRTGGSDVFAQRFNAAAQPQGAEWKILSFVGTNASAPSVASDADGDFVIAWQGQEGAGSVPMVQFNVYNAAGNQIGVFGESGTGVPARSSPSVAMDADGDIVLAWHGSAPAGVSDPAAGVYAQRFTLHGFHQGGLIHVNTTTALDQSEPSVAMDADGDFVVAWHGNTNDSYWFDVYAQRYTRLGAPQGSEITVTHDFGATYFPTVAADADGDFTVIWNSQYLGFGRGFGVAARRYTAAGSPDGGAFVVAYNANDQFDDGGAEDPSLAVDADGDAVITYRRTTTTFGVVSLGNFAQRYDQTTDPSGPTVAGVVVGGRSIHRNGADRVAPQSSQFAVNVSEALSTAGGVGGAGSATNVSNWRLSRNGADVSALLQSVTFGRNPVDGKYQALFNLSVPLTFGGNYVLTAKGALRDPAGNLIDGDRNGAAGGGDYAFPFVLINDAPGSLGIEAVNVAEDEAPTEINLFDVFGDANEPDSGLDFSVSNPDIFLFRSTTIDPATGTLRLEYVPNAYGSALVTVRAMDSGDVTTSVTFTVNVAPENDAPVNNLPKGRQAVVAGAPLVFSAANGNAIFVTDVDAPDAGTAGQVLVTLQAPRDSTITLGSTDGVLVTTDTPDRVTVVGLLGAVNGALNGLRLTNLGSRETTLTITTSDLGHTGAGGVLGDVDVVPIVVEREGRIEVAAGDASVLEGDERNVAVGVEVTLSAASTTPVRVAYATGDGTAQSGSDYNRESGTLTFQPGELRKVVAVTTLGDTTFEPDETFVLRLSDAEGAVIGRRDGTVTIANNDPAPPLPALSVGDVSVVEGDAGTSAATFTVTLSFASSSPVTVNYATTDAGATASEGDYSAASGTLTFAPGVTSQAVTVQVAGDTAFEPDETFALDLSAPAGAALGDPQGLATIVNDDAPGAPPRVTQVFMSGSAWSAAFKTYLQSRGQGDAAFGYAVPAGAGGAQLAVLPWGNLDQLSVRFDKDVLVLLSDLDLRGVMVAGGHYALSGFAYDDATRTATWTLAQPLRNDRLLLDLDGGEDGVADAATGALLDGQWVNGTSAYPSGDGAAGGDFQYRLNVLAGDSGGTGVVSAQDWMQERLRWDRSTTSPGTGAFVYAARYDLDGDGRIDDRDLRVIRRNLGRRLPAAAPATVPAAAASAAPVTTAAARAARLASVSATRDLFGTTTILA